MSYTIAGGNFVHDLGQNYPSTSVRNKSLCVSRRRISRARLPSTKTSAGRHRAL